MWNGFSCSTPTLHTISNTVTISSIQFFYGKLSVFGERGSGLLAEREGENKKGSVLEKAVNIKLFDYFCIFIYVHRTVTVAVLSIHSFNVKYFLLASDALPLSPKSFPQ